MPQIHDRKEYRAFPALNQSAAKHLLTSPAHYQAYIHTPQEETKALRFGTFVHSAILEPHTLNDLYATAPDCDKRTKEGKAMWSEFATANAGKTILDAEESAMGHLVASSARFTLKRLGVEFDATEVMYHVDYNGVPLKAAIDGVAGDYLWDIKTTGPGEATPAGMLKSIRNYRYNLQAYWYRLVYELATGKRPLGFRFLFVEGASLRHRRLRDRARAHVLGNRRLREGADDLQGLRRVRRLARLPGRHPGHRREDHDHRRPHHLRLNHEHTEPRPPAPEVD